MQNIGRLMHCSVASDGSYIGGGQLGTENEVMGVEFVVGMKLSHLVWFLGKFEWHNSFEL